MTVECPFCKEEIQKDAVKCKHCQSIIEPYNLNRETPQNLPKAGFWIRAGAFFIDYLAVDIALLAAVVVLVLLTVSTGAVDTESAEPPAIITTMILLVFIGVPLAYFAVLNANGRQTLGKRLMGIRTIRTGGEGLTLTRSLGRSFAYMVSYFPFVIPGLYLGYIWAGIDGNKQAWHDKIVDTYVVKVEETNGTLIVVSIVVGSLLITMLLAMLAAIAIPQFAKYQEMAAAKIAPYASSTTAAAVTSDISMIAIIQELHYAKHGRYAALPPNPSAARPAGGESMSWEESAPWMEFGYSPSLEKVNHRYSVETDEDGESFFIRAEGNLDDDPELDLWELDSATMEPVHVFDDLMGG